jgi:hypothetical protein
LSRVPQEDKRAGDNRRDVVTDILTRNTEEFEKSSPMQQTPQVPSSYGPALPAGKNNSSSCGPNPWSGQDTCYIQDTLF